MKLLANERRDLDLEGLRFADEFGIRQHGPIGVQQCLHPLGRHIGRSDERAPKLGSRGQQFEKALVIVALREIGEQRRALQVARFVERRLHEDHYF